MKILVVSGFWPTLANPITGIFVVQQVQAYLELGCDVTVIVPQNIRGRGRGRPYHQRVGEADVFSPTFFDIPQMVSGGNAAVALNTLSCAKAILRVLKRIGVRKDFDGVHIHEVRYGGLSYVKWIDQVKSPSIITIHGVDPFVQSRVAMPWFSQKFHELWAEVRHVTLVGNPLQSYADRLGIPKNKRSVVHNGSEIPPAWNSDQRPLSDRRVIMSVSNLVQLKGIDLNLNALARFRREKPTLDWEYRIIGDGPERVSLQRLAGELAIDDRVYFLGQFDHRNTLEQIADCDVFSLPSWGENFGIVYLEAMGRGRPVIGCRDWGAAEMVRDGVDGILVEPRSEDSLYRALTTLLVEPNVCQRMGQSARARAEMFTWRGNVHQHLALFGGPG
jgi:glycosyltransferase involved in cell wall biosynthesis